MLLLFLKPSNLRLIKLHTHTKYQAFIIVYISVQGNKTSIKLKKGGGKTDVGEGVLEGKETG